MIKPILRTGIVGSGFAARFHLDALQRVYSVKVEIEGVFSPTREKLEQFTKPGNLKPYINLEKLIDDVDVIHVCTPPITHEPIVVTALKENKHVVVEKPFTGYFGNGCHPLSAALYLKLLAASCGEPSLRARRSQCARGDANRWKEGITVENQSGHKLFQHVLRHYPYAKLQG